MASSHKGVREVAEVLRYVEHRHMQGPPTGPAVRGQDPFLRGLYAIQAWKTHIRGGGVSWRTLYVPRCGKTSYAGGAPTNHVVDIVRLVQCCLSVGSGR